MVIVGAFQELCGRLEDQVQQRQAEVPMVPSRFSLMVSQVPALTMVLKAAQIMEDEPSVKMAEMVSHKTAARAELVREVLESCLRHKQKANFPLVMKKATGTWTLKKKKKKKKGSMRV
jgi:hypothetical protein